MAGTTDTIKKYVGLASNALAYALQADTAIKSSVSDTEPPVGSKDSYGNATGGGLLALGGSSTLILLAVAAWFFLFRKEQK